MAEVKPMKIDGVDERKRPAKRKRLEFCLNFPTAEEKQAKIVESRKEIDSLVKYCKKLVSENREALSETSGKLPASLNSVIACLIEGSSLPLSKVVDEIFEKVKGRSGNGNGFSKASVKNAVLMIGQRLCYGVVAAEADVLEDEDDSALWFWETRDLKLIPKSAHIYLKALRAFRSKIRERITAVLAMINVLEKSENLPNWQHELVKASEKLGKVLNEADIRFSMEKISHKNGAEMAEKETKGGEKLIFKQMEKNKRENERERKNIVRERQKEMLQNKQVKREQDKAEKDERRREKEEAESRKQLALKKQASLMERFLKRNKTSSSLANDSSLNKSTTSESAMRSMDTLLAQKNIIEVEDIWKSHLNAWRSNRYSNKKMHWGIRQKPKTELFNELKLITNTQPTCRKNLDIEKLVVGFYDINDDRRLSQTKRVSVKLLQFDRSHRPAFYGVWPRNSEVVGPRHPFVKDSEINYEIDSDEEWTEDEPGESLSDDDEDESMEEDDDEEDDNEDGFFVPDSENEGVKVDDERDSKAQSVATHLNNLTEYALKRNKPLIILNLMHEKTAVSSELITDGRLKLERLALQSLGMCSSPCFSNAEISVPQLL